jgi:hypothetical protein
LLSAERIEAWASLQILYSDGDIISLLCLNNQNVNIVTRWRTIDGVWIGDRIYAHVNKFGKSLLHTVPLLCSGFQR